MPDLNDPQSQQQPQPPVSGVIDGGAPTQPVETVQPPQTEAAPTMQTPEPQAEAPAQTPVAPPQTREQKDVAEEAAREADQVKSRNSLQLDMAFLKAEALKKPPFRSVIKIVNSIISEAFKARASDIHMDPAEKALRLRYRIDGVLHDVFDFDKALHSEIITRIKVLSGLRTDEHQATQDGRMRIAVTETEFVDVRVSIVPTYYGENCVMRLLIDRADDFDLEDLGFSETDLKKIVEAIKKPYGLILATGPTGSGKTTTLYMILKRLNNPDVSIVTIEDPIEYSLEGVDQIQVNTKTGLLFSTGLRAILRQDPNIVMVGEIRDSDTASIAINAAMTGHLVLSTLHTNDAPTTLPRLLDLGVEPFLIATTLNIAIGQRLVRTICEDCKVKVVLTPEELVALKQSLTPTMLALLGNNKVFYRGEGCPRCGGTGYRGRIGIHEVMEVTQDIKDLIIKKATSDEIQAKAIENGMTTMTQDGFAKALKGVTTIEEVLRVFHE